MKITDPEVIKTGEKDLIDAVKEDLDLDAIKKILQNKIAATTLTANGGQIVVHNNDIAFRLDFDLNLTGSLMFDREGNYISDTDTPPAEQETDEQDLPEHEEVEQEPVDQTDDLDQANQNGQTDENSQTDQDDENDAIDLPEPELDDIPAEEDPEELLGKEKDPEDGLDMENLTEESLEDTDLLEPEDDPIDDDLETQELDDSAEDDLPEETDMDDILQESREFWEQDNNS